MKDSIDILGVDPGLANIGVSYFPNKFGYTITTSKELPQTMRIEMILEQINDIMSVDRVELLIIEDFKNFGRRKNVDAIQKVVGGLVGLAIAHGIEYVLYEPAKWLKHLGINGNDHKEKTRQLILERDWTVDSQHAIDACGLIEAYLNIKDIK